jgi:dolichol-phosphate mannosyltransferase
MNTTEAADAVSVVVPTYNERENLPALLERLDAVLSGTTARYEVLVVDDDSPDETWKVAASHAEEYPVQVIRRTEESGLATAVVRGLGDAAHATVVVMDGDLQHPPESLLDLLAAIERGADIVVGSRFVKGGSPGEFGPVRLLTTFVANVIAKVLFPELRGLTDVQSGFFAIRTDTVDCAPLDPVGYKILLEILIKCDYHRLEEIGYEFRPRGGGQSNMDLWTILAYLYHVWLLTRYRRWDRQRLDEKA